MPKLALFAGMAISFRFLYRPCWETCMGSKDSPDGGLSVCSQEGLKGDAMFIATQGINAYNVFYMGTDPNIPKPGPHILQLRKEGIGLAEGYNRRGLIEADRITDVEVGYEVIDKGVSAGKAVVGGMLAGGIGAIAGAAMGSKRVEPHVTISYHDTSGNPQQVVVAVKQSGQAEKICKKLRKRYLTS